MICSLNEIGATLRRAAVGSGYPVGLADDIAAAGLWLSNRGIDGVDAVLTTLASGYDQDADWGQHGSLLQVSQAVIGRCGVSLCELLVTGEVDHVIVDHADSPMLLAGCAGVVADATGVAFSLYADRGDPIIVTAHAETSVAGLGKIRTGSTIRIETLPDALRERVADPPTPTTCGVEVDEARWSIATRLAARTYVPATDASRRDGAGAGLDDND